MDEIGPWNDYELIDDREKKICGVRRKDDPNAKVVTPNYICSLQNPVLPNEGLWGTHGAVIITEDGEVYPNKQAT